MQEVLLKSALFYIDKTEARKEYFTLKADEAQAFMYYAAYPLPVRHIQA